MIVISKQLAIPEDEIVFTASRSSGPGGQHTNKASTRVTLYFDVAASPSLTAEQRARISERLRSRIGKNGMLRVVAQTQRSQTVNRELALARFVELLRAALAKKRVRRPTAPTAAAKEKRLTQKRRRGEQKRERARGDDSRV